MYDLDWPVDKCLHPAQLYLINSCLLPPAPLFSLHLPSSPCCSTSQSSVTSVPTPRSHTFTGAHTHAVRWRTHSWTVCGNGRSVLRPCWGAADWSCTDLPPGPWGFVKHVCGAGLNTFSHSLSVFVSLSHSSLSSDRSVVPCYAVQWPPRSPTSRSPSQPSVFYL